MAQFPDIIAVTCSKKKIAIPCATFYANKICLN